MKNKRNCFSFFPRIHPISLLLSMMFLFITFNGSEAQSQILQPVEYNKDQLVKMAVQGQISEARMSYPPYRIGADGKLSVVPGTESIVYNFRTGDSAVNMAGDHIEPAVTLRHPSPFDSPESRGFTFLSCIGNTVRVLTGEAKGEIGYIIGKHGDPRVMVDFKDPEVLKKLTLNDKMHIYAHGVGMEFTNVEGVKIMSTSPALIDALTEAGMGVTEEGKLRINVALKVPAKIMGSGLRRSHSHSGDYDIQMFDEEVVNKYNLDRLRFGDIVAIINADVSYGRIYRTGAITIGVVSHGNSVVAGHGPGVTTLFTSTEGNIDPVLDSDANLKNLLFK